MATIGSNEPSSFVPSPIQVSVGFVADDGGRAAAGFHGATGDCTTRAIAIATGVPYQEVYDALNALGKRERRGKKRPSRARTGVSKQIIRRYMAGIGWDWVPTMRIGTGCTVHLRADELQSADSSSLYRSTR
jgi:hypothetical protein